MSRQKIIFTNLNAGAAVTVVELGGLVDDADVDAVLDEDNGMNESCGACADL